jgi:hypothetical protein
MRRRKNKKKKRRRRRSRRRKRANDNIKQPPGSQEALFSYLLTHGAAAVGTSPS